MNYTKKQHYISRYILKRFLNQNGKIDAVLLQSSPKRIQASIDNVFSEKDFYETKDKSGTYINRNRTENKFADMESELAKWVDKFISILDSNDRNEILKEATASGEYENFTVWLMLHLTLVLIRLPKVKQIAFKSDIPFEMQQVFYNALIWGDHEAKHLAKFFYEDNDLNQIEKIFDEDSNTGAITTLMNHIINNHYIETYEVPEDKKLYLSDNPVIINDITSIDYFLPLSPQYAIAIKKIPGDKSFKFHYAPFIMKDSMVDNVNKVFIKNASNFVVVQNMTKYDEQFITDCISN